MPILPWRSICTNLRDSYSPPTPTSWMYDANSAMKSPPSFHTHRPRSPATTAISCSAPLPAARPNLLSAAHGEERETESDFWKSCDRECLCRSLGSSNRETTIPRVLRGLLRSIAGMIRHGVNGWKSRVGHSNTLVMETLASVRRDHVYASEIELLKWQYQQPQSISSKALLGVFWTFIPSSIQFKAIRNKLLYPLFFFLSFLRLYIITLAATLY